MQLRLNRKLGRTSIILIFEIRAWPRDYVSRCTSLRLIVTGALISRRENVNDEDDKPGNQDDASCPWVFGDRSSETVICESFECRNEEL